MSRSWSEDSTDDDDEYPVHTPLVRKGNPVLLPRNREVDHGGSQSATSADARVWPPILLGRRKRFGENQSKPYVYVNTPKIVVPGTAYLVSPTDAIFDAMAIHSVKHADCPIYVFPPSAQGYRRAIHFDGNPSAVKESFPMLNLGWTLKYGTVKDMLEIDPHKKHVDWKAMHSSYPAVSKEISMIGAPEGLSTLHNEDFQAKIRDINDAQIFLQKCVEESMDAEDFASKLDSLLFQEREASLKNYLAEVTCRQSQSTENDFAINWAYFANASFERLSSLGVLLKGAGDIRDRAGSMFTSKMIKRGTEVELRALQSTAEEIRRATTNKKKLAQLQLDLLDSTGKLMAEQNKEMGQHLLECATKSRKIVVEDTVSRKKLGESLRQAKEKISVLQKFISAGASEIAEEVHSDALKERDQEHAATLTRLEEAKSKQECCICYNELDGFSVSSNHGESSSLKKLHKRACFLPCMHANVCATCAERRWDKGPKECPICRQRLTEKPRVIYL